MSLYTEEFFRDRVGSMSQSAADTNLRTASRSASGFFDVFLSHSLHDARVILGIREWLRAQDLRVYVDWIDDRELDRSTVSAATAARLRTQMGKSRSLIYVTSRAARASRWMPWELGYFDGLNGSEQVSIMRLNSASDKKFVGEEYLGLYKQIERVRNAGVLVPYAVRPSGKEGESLASFAHATARFVNLVQP